MRKLIEQFKSGAFADPATPIGALLYALVFAIMAWIIGRALRLAVQRVLARDKRAYVDRTTVNFLSQVAQFGVYLFAFISYAHLVPALSHLGSAWLASVGVISVVVGMAAQNTLGNLIAGFSLVLYRPFKVGDRLQVAAPGGLETGVVESINLGYTVLKTDDNRRIVIPNSAIASQTTINLSGEDPRVACSVPISISCDAEIDKARAILLELARQHPKAQEVTGCPLTQWGPNGIVLTLSAWCLGPGAAADLKNDLLEQARKRFNREGIGVPFPRMEVRMENGATPDDESKHS
jgi:small-conductance mechanosensitive channel